MTKLIVEVHNATDLMPKDGHGTASPFVKVEFEGQRQRTQTKQDLNPQWNETLVFNTAEDLLRGGGGSVEVTVCNDRLDKSHRKNFLGRVKISASSLPLSSSEASVQRYPLEKRDLFSHVQGDIALRIYADATLSAEPEPPLQEINPNRIFHEDVPQNHHHHQSQVPPENDPDSDRIFKTKKKEKEVRTFHSIATGAPPPSMAAEKPSPAVPPPAQMFEVRRDFAQVAPPQPATVMRMQMPRPQNPEFGLVETSPPLAGRLRRRGGGIGGDKTASTYDLVEQMHFLYVSVVKARDLPVMDISGSLDPYVEVKLGNYKGVTKHVEKNQNPAWKQIFAFSKERLQSNLVEITVKDKDFGKDDFVGRVMFDLTEVPIRVPPDSPLAPQWYKLEDKHGVKTRGEVMLAVWMGTQADESFPEAWHSDAHSVSHVHLANTRSKVYFSPKLYYLRIHVIEAQDLVPSDRGRAVEAYVKVQLGNQVRITRPSQMRMVNAVWNDELMFVASEPFEDFIVVSVEERVGPGKDEVMGRVILSVRDVLHRVETSKLPDARWFNLMKASSAGGEETEKKKEKFSSKIHLRLCLEAGYHVLDESTHFSSDLQPSSKHLRKPNIGILELGILSARNLLPMKGKEGRSTDSYCVVKYGNKWVRTRTLLDTLSPRWNEQYTWEVHDPCTVITVGVFDNSHTNGGGDASSRDQRIGKVRIRLSTLETDRVYSHYYPLLVLQPGGLKKHGELQLAIRFTCTAWVNMVAQYGRPLLPKMHYLHPISVKYIDLLRHQAMQIVAARLARAEPPLRRENVEYMLDVDYHMWSLRRSKANFQRIMSVMSGVSSMVRWVDDICRWRNPITTCLVHVLFLMLVCYPELILPTVFLYLFVIGMWNYRFRPRDPPHMDARLSQAEFTHPDELDEEFDTFPSSKSPDVVRMRYDRMRSVAGRVQTVVGDLASQLERAQALLNWRDPRATAIFILFSLLWALFIYVTPFQVVALLLGLYCLRHPRFRSKMPSVPVNFFKRLPSKSDMLL